MNKKTLYNWQRLSFFNLFLVSCLGVTLRYKILFPLPIVDQKFLLHAHSHFAFAGWITQILMTFIIKYLYDANAQIAMRKYQWLLFANVISAYGMLISFPFEGYGAISITFSTLSIFVSYAFAFFVWRDLNRLAQKNISHKWFKAALAFNAISSLGAFSLAFMMATKTIDPNSYLAAIYFFLHFQYNGWFFFACIGLLYVHIIKNNLVSLLKNSNAIFWLFFSAAIPAYLLSVLWLNMPIWLYTLIVAAVLIQSLGFVFFLQAILKNKRAVIQTVSKPVKILWLLVLIALTIKLSLQLVSVIPSLSQLTTGFRPIVIGYLHLVLLGVITIFLIGYFAAANAVYSKVFFKGVTIFVTGIIINEVLLMIQGITAITYLPVPYINEMLLGAALVLFSGLMILNIGLMNKKNLVHYHQHEKKDQYAFAIERSIRK